MGVPRVSDLPEVATGVAVFQPRSDDHFCYKLLASGDKLRVWLENCSTKKQWQTADLELAAFASASNVGTSPWTSFQDYVKTFKVCLESPLSAGPCTRHLTDSLKYHDALEVTLSTKLQTVVATWTPTYTFVLQPIAMESADGLAASVRDHAAELSKLHEQIGLLSAQVAASRSDPSSNSPVQITLAKWASNGEVLRWEHAKSKDLWARLWAWMRPSWLGAVCGWMRCVVSGIEFESDGSMRFLYKGEYVVTVVLHTSGPGLHSVELRLEGKTVATARTTAAQSKSQLLTAHCKITIDYDRELTVTYRGDGTVTTRSTITISQL